MRANAVLRRPPLERLIDQCARPDDAKPVDDHISDTTVLVQLGGHDCGSCVRCLVVYNKLTTCFQVCQTKLPEFFYCRLPISVVYCNSVNLTVAHKRGNPLSTHPRRNGQSAH